MEVLLDTNVLVALLNSSSREHDAATRAVRKLAESGGRYWLAPQVLVEFWVVATRPLAMNGLGWTVEQTAREIEELLAVSRLLKETPELFRQWFELVAQQRVLGKRVHDARLAALMLVHGLTHVLTFDAAGFPPAWGITPLFPEEVAGVAPGQ